MKSSTFIIKLLSFFVLFPFTLKSQPTEDIEREQKKMEIYARECADNYVTYLNQIADIKERKWLEDDIQNMINDSFNGADSVWVYDNLNTVNTARDSLLLKDYLKNLSSEALFPNGITFDYQYRDIQLCRIEDKDSTKLFQKPHYKVKLYYIVDYKTKAGEVRQDEIDIVVRFEIKTSRPLQIDDRPFIVKTHRHREETCPEYEIVGDTCHILLSQLSEKEKQLLRNKAEVVVKNYANALNSLDEKNFVKVSDIMNYFDQTNSKIVYDDLSLKIRDTIPYTALGYIHAFQDTKKRYSKKEKPRKLYLDYYFVEGREVLEPIISKTKQLEEYFIVKVAVFRKMKISDYPVNTVKLIFDVKFPITDCQINLDRNVAKIVKISPEKRKTQPVYYWTAGMGLMGYFGDITPFLNGSQNSFALLRSALTIQASKKVTPHWHIRLGVTYGQVRADDYTHSQPQASTNRFLRNLHFRNNIFEVSAVGVYDWFAYDKRFFRRKRFVPYSFVGIAVFNHNPQAKTPAGLGENWVNLQELGTEGQGQEGYAKPYSKTQIALPLGLGVRVKLHERIDINLEANFRYTFTDYLDDVSGSYAEIGDLGSSLAKTMSNRSNESTAILRNIDRQAQLATIYRITGNPQEFVSSDGQTYAAVQGYGRRGDARGNSLANDMYFTVGFQLSYFINTGNSYKRQQKINKRREVKHQDIEDKIEFEKKKEELEKERLKRRNTREFEKVNKSKKKKKDKS